MGAAKSILERMIAKTAETAEDVALKAASKARDYSADGSNKLWEALQARKNLKLAEEAKATNESIRAKVLQTETEPRFKAPEPTAEQLDNIERARQMDMAKDSYNANVEAEKAKRAYDPKAVADADEATKASNTQVAAAAALPAMAPGFTNPADIVKAGYDKFQKVRQSVVDKIVDLTDMTANNPHVPQYAKDTYNKAADALVSNATDPLNYVGGAGAADALAGAGGAAYDMYKGGSGARMPSSTPVERNPATNPVQKVNWPK